MEGRKVRRKGRRKGGKKEVKKRIMVEYKLSLTVKGQPTSKHFVLLSNTLGIVNKLLGISSERFSNGEQNP